MFTLVYPPNPRSHKRLYPTPLVVTPRRAHAGIREWKLSEGGLISSRVTPCRRSASGEHHPVPGGERHPTVRVGEGSERLPHRLCDGQLARVSDRKCRRSGPHEGAHRTSSIVKDNQTLDLVVLMHRQASGC